MRGFQIVLVVVAGVQLFIGGSWQLEGEKGDGSRTAAVSQLRELVRKSNLPLDKEETEDFRLANWLAFKDFDVEGAFKAIKENAEWRKQEKIDTITTENWKDLKTRFPYTRDTIDKEGRPVTYFDFGAWDVAGFLGEAGEGGPQRYLRYWAMIAEEAEENVRSLRAQGNKVTQFSMLANLADYSTSKHACIQCLWAYREICSTAAPQYLPSLSKMTVVNAPLVFRGVFAIFSTVVQENFVIYGQDRSQWEPMLLEAMDKNQIPAKLLANAEPHEKDNSEGWLPWKFEL